MANTDGDILLRLIISGQSPQEVQRLAEATQGQLNAEIAKKLNDLTLLHIAANQKITDDQRKQVEARIKEQTKALDLVNQIRVANKEAAEATASAWKKTAEVTADVTISLHGLYETITGGFEKFKRLGEEIVKNAQIYGSLKGSIDGMRESTGGAIADIDLITLKNRAFEKDLSLTDAQFAAVAKQANHFASALGGNTKEAMDKIIDGLASGNMKALQHAGIIIDTEKAYKKFAEAQGLVVEKMTDQEKLLAVQAEALTKIKNKTTDMGEEGVTVAHLLEVAFAKTKNAITGTLAAIGNTKLSAPTDYAAGDLEQVRQDSIARGDPGLYQRALAVRDKARAAEAAARKAAALTPYSEEELQAQQDQFFGGGTGAYGKSADTRSGADFQEAYKKRQEALRKLAEEAKRAQAEFDALQKTYASFERMLRGGKGEGTPGLDVVQLTEEQRSHDLDMAFDSTGSRRAAPGGLSGGLARQAALQKAFAAKEERDQEEQDRLVQQAADAMAAVNDEALNDTLDKRHEMGSGILATLLFGQDGKEKLIEDIDAWHTATKDAMDMVSAAGMQMADALGAALAAFVSGDKSKRKSVRDTTHDILESLAAQAYARAIFETAEGLASLALGPIGGVSAGMHFAAAGMFATVGTAAGLGARAVGQSSTSSTGTKAGSSAGAGSGSGSGVSSSGSSSFGSGGVRSSGGRGNSDQPVVININSPLGDRAEIGRSISIALAEYYSQSGRGVPLSPGSV